MKHADESKGGKRLRQYCKRDDRKNWGVGVGNFKKVQHLNGSSQVFPQKVAKLNEKSN